MIGLGWNFWIKTYFSILFSKEMWLSRFFFFIEVVLIASPLTNTKSVFWTYPAAYILVSSASLLFFASVFALLMSIHVYHIWKASKEQK